MAAKEEINIVFLFFLGGGGYMFYKMQDHQNPTLCHAAISS